MTVAFMHFSLEMCPSSFSARIASRVFSGFSQRPQNKPCPFFESWDELRRGFKPQNLWISDNKSGKRYTTSGTRALQRCYAERKSSRCIDLGSSGWPRL